MDHLELHNETEVLQQLSQGCEHAFGKIYAAYSPRLYARLRRILKSDALAEEVLQDVFLVVWKNRHLIDIQKSFCSYIFCIAANKACDLFRKSLRDRKLHGELARTTQHQCPATDERLVKKEDVQNVHQAIALLPPKRKQVFVLCRLEGKSYDEVSRQLGISQRTISDHIVKANLFLKKYLMQPEA